MDLQPIPIRSQHTMYIAMAVKKKKTVKQKLKNQENLVLQQQNYYQKQDN